MAFFDKLQEVAKTIGEKTTETMKVVGDKTNDAVEITKQKAKISQEKSAILDVKKQIGELVWNEYSGGAQFSDDIKALCESIKEHCDAIAVCEKEIERVKADKPEAAKPAEEAAPEEVAEPKAETDEPAAEEASEVKEQSPEADA